MDGAVCKRAESLPFLGSKSWLVDVHRSIRVSTLLTTREDSRYARAELCFGVYLEGWGVVELMICCSRRPTIRGAIQSAPELLRIGVIATAQFRFFHGASIFVHIITIKFRSVAAYRVCASALDMKIDKQICVLDSFGP